MSLGKAKAKSVLDSLEIDDPSLLVNLNEICMARGVFVREGHIDGAEARLTIGDSFSRVKAVILARPNDTYETRTRFSIAHELGHFELHKNIQATISCSERELNEWFGKQAHQEREIEANEFASELLLPERFIRPVIHAQSNPSLNLVDSLASKYQTSFIATARRLIDLTEEACALVFFKKDRILYHVPSELFRRQHYWIALGPLDMASMAYDAATKGKNGAYMSAVDAATWVDISEMKDWQRSKIEDAKILEQARFFPKLDLGISLLWIKDPKLIWN
ncbi:MAG: ImmA/IrrE family metallo-endopeptidase [Deltaproteobacteria bacterium]|nr:ImmA/IrrE family metallo-endopeptidase [Deltaproteobacteria bacterium]